MPKHIQKKTVKQEQFFRDNPFHPSLRLHKLEGKLSGHWTLSIDRFYRIIFTIDEKGDIVFTNGETAAGLSYGQLEFSGNEPGYFRRMFDDYSAKVLALAVGAGTFVFYGSKIILGFMGYNGPCGNNMIACKCANM